MVQNNNINKYIPTVEDARYINYNTYHNDSYDYSIDYPDDDYFQISKTYEDGMRLQNDNGEVLISLTSNWMEKLCNKHMIKQLEKNLMQHISF